MMTTTDIAERPSDADAQSAACVEPVAGDPRRASLASRLIARGRGALRRFREDRSGAVALMFGLMIIPMLGAIGLAIDFGAVMVARSKAQMAADASALQATGIARELLKAGSGSDAETTAAIANAKARAEALFAAHAAQAGLKNYTLTFTMTRTGQALEARAAFRVTTPNFVGKLFGQPTFAAAGSSASTSSLPTYSDVYLALDVSGSMGIAASRPDMVKLFNAKGSRKVGASQPTSCVFGCHMIEADQGWSESFSSVAKRNGVKLRIDVLREAVKSMIVEAQKDADSLPIYRLALYGLGGSLDGTSWALTQFAPITDNFTTLNTAASNIDIQNPIILPKYQRSYINEQLNYASGILPQSKDGSSQANSKKYLFLITDGARDVPPSWGSCSVPPVVTTPEYMSSGRCTNAIDPTYCKALKDKGITVSVLYTTYIPVTVDPADANSALEKWYNLEMVRNKYKGTSVAALLSPKLQECASPGWFYEASDEAGIKAAMEKMFKQTSSAPSLSF